MKLAALGLIAFLLASPHSPASPPAETGAPFEASRETFADPPACIAHLAAFVQAGADFDAAIGPYRVAPGDMRAHRVRAEGGGHEIEERRCLVAALSTRRWTHSLDDVRPITMDDIEKMSFPE